MATYLPLFYVLLFIVAFLYASVGHGGASGYLAWYAMNHWLQDFAYKIDLSWWIFGLAAAISILITLITVSQQAIKVAIANPVKSLHSE
jgi:ABC-type antimicrobial peptide transport system permease subunit